LDHIILALSNVNEFANALKEGGTTPKAVEQAISTIRGGRRVESKSAEGMYEALSKYAVDLVALAESGKLDPVIGRDEEVSSLSFFFWRISCFFFVYNVKYFLTYFILFFCEDSKSNSNFISSYEK